MCIPRGLRTGLTEVPLRNLGSLFQRDVNLKLNQNRHLLGYVVDQVMSPARPAWTCLSSVCHPGHHMGIRAEGPAAWGLLCLWKPGQVKAGSPAQWPSRRFSGTQTLQRQGKLRHVAPGHCARQEGHVHSWGSPWDAARVLGMASTRPGSPTWQS